MNFSMDTSLARTPGKHAALAKRLQDEKDARQRALSAFYHPDGVPKPIARPAVGMEQDQARRFHNVVRRHKREKSG